jgi:hypothetical protein
MNRQGQMLIATENTRVSNCDFKGEHNTLDIFGVVTTLAVSSRLGIDGPPAPYDMHDTTQWKHRRFA